jgi:hypothetical protein
MRDPLLHQGDPLLSLGLFGSRERKNFGYRKMIEFGRKTFAA